MRRLAGLLLVISSSAFAADLAILPGKVALVGPEDFQQLLAEATVESHQEDWTRAAEWSSSDAKVATVDQTGMVRPEKVLKPIYKDVLHADLDDPYLGLGKELFASYPFAKEDEGPKAP